MNANKPTPVDMLAPTLTRTPTTIQVVTIDSLIPGAESERKVAKLKTVLDDTTYMMLQVIAAPFQGSLVISVQGEAIDLTQEELQGMVISKLASAVMNRE